MMNSSYIGSKRRKTLIPSLLQTTYEQDRGFQQEQKPIKIEPRDKTSPHHNMSTSPLHVYPTAYTDQQNWGMGLGGGLMVGGGHPQQQFQELQWGGAAYAPPALQPASPHHHLLSPHTQVVPNMAQSPMHRVVSPMGQSMHDVGSPMGQQMHGATSPMGHSMHGATSPMGHSMHGATSPMGHSMHGATSPMGHSMHGGASPMGHSMQGATSPHMVQHIDYTQQEGGSSVAGVGAGAAGVSGTSLSALLERAEGAEGAALSSGELLGLSALLADRNSDLLSTDLHRLSTNDMLF